MGAKITTYQDGTNPTEGRSPARNCVRPDEASIGFETHAGITGVVVVSKTRDSVKKKVLWPEAGCFPLLTSFTLYNRDSAIVVIYLTQVTALAETCLPIARMGGGPPS